MKVNKKEAKIMNQKDFGKDDIAAEKLVDLPIAGERADETKAGAGPAGFLGPPIAEPKIGGKGSDVLIGGSGDDLLIAGTTSY